MIGADQKHYRREEEEEEYTQPTRPLLSRTQRSNVLVALIVVLRDVGVRRFNDDIKVEHNISYYAWMRWILSQLLQQLQCNEQ